MRNLFEGIDHLLCVAVDEYEVSFLEAGNRLALRIADDHVDSRELDPVVENGLRGRLSLLRRDGPKDSASDHDDEGNA
jgi:hypothetical protein